MMIDKNQAQLILELLGTVQSQVPLSPAEQDLRDKVFENFPEFREQYSWVGKRGY